MTQQPSDERIWEALEVCRPDRDEASDPALARLIEEMAAHPQLGDFYQQIQDFDARLAERFQQLPVPPGLAKRIQAQLAIKSAETTEASLLEAVVCSSTAEPYSPPWDASPAAARSTEKTFRCERAVSRRWLLTAGGLITIAAALFVMLYLGLRKADTCTPETALHEAIRYFMDEDAPPGDLLNKQSRPQGIAFSRAVSLHKGTRWRKIRDFLGRDGVAFDLPSREGARATLYVIQRSVGELPTVPPLRPFTTGRCAAAVWQEREFLYVLVVQGGPRTFQHFLKVSHSPIA
jgi:hypothetical protein